MRKIYYFLKPLIPRFVQIILRRKIATIKIKKYQSCWPINKQANKLPEKWHGWPESKKFAFILTHDVDAEKGLARCIQLVEIEKEFEFQSSFNFIPGKYKVPDELRHYLVNNGFEVGIHGLKHDGKLYKNYKTFQNRAVSINKYLKEWGAVGFRSPAMHHNLDWLHDLNIEYDASTFDTDPFEPQSSGIGTIFPLWVKGDSNKDGYIELPYTLPQDFTLFIIMKETNIDIWKQKLDWIVESGGMALLNTHPNLMNFMNEKLKREEYPVELYLKFLQYVSEKYRGMYWHSLPVQISRFWRTFEA